VLKAGRCDVFGDLLFSIENKRPSEKQHLVRFLVDNFVGDALVGVWVSSYPGENPIGEPHARISGGLYWSP
jgi:hypothetical protein